MGREVKIFESEERKSREQVVDFLRQIADKIAAGKVVLSRGAEELVVEIPESLVLEVQVEDEDKGTKGTQHSLEVELKWYDGDAQGGPLELK